jgi:tetratricopeptide (TPR) repeat protein
MRQLFLCFLFGLFLNACSPKEQKLSKEEAIAFSQKLQAAMARQSPNMVDSIFYIPVFAKRVADYGNIAFNGKLMSNVSTAILNAKWGKEILRSMGKDGSFEFVRHYEKEKRHHAIFRLYSSAGVNYFDFELVKYKDEIKAADIYVFTLGQNISESLAEVIDIFEKHEKNKEGQEKYQYQKHLKEIKALIRERQFQDAKKYFDKLPESFKKERLFMVMNITICSELDDDLYKAALVQLESKFSNDPSTQLFLIDSYILDKDFDHALEAIDVLDNAVKTDPLLNFLRGNIYAQKEDYSKAIFCYEQLKKDKPEFDDGIIELMNAYFTTGEVEKGKELVSEYQENKSLDQEKLGTIKMLYPQYVSE